MSVTQLTPYLFFDGQADQAIRFYQEALGAEVEGLMRYDQLPAEAGTCPPEDLQRVMHALLRLGGASVMVSDSPSAQPTAASGVHVNIGFDDADEMARRFRALAEGGSVTMDLHDAFWGDKFGALQDRFGVHWMFTCPTTPAGRAG